MLTLYHQTGSDDLLASGDQPMFILLACRQKLLIQSGDIQCFRYRHPMVAVKVSGFPFNAAFLMWLCRCAKLRFEPPVAIRNATKRAVSSRRDPRRIFFTAEVRLS